MNLLFKKGTCAYSPRSESDSSPTQTLDSLETALAFCRMSRGTSPPSGRRLMKEWLGCRKKEEKKKRGGGGWSSTEPRTRLSAVPQRGGVEGTKNNYSETRERMYFKLPENIQYILVRNWVEGRLPVSLVDGARPGHAGGTSSSPYPQNKPRIQIPINLTPYHQMFCMFVSPSFS